MKNIKEKKERNSSLELLRIICMILIIASHYSFHGKWPEFTISNISFNTIFVQILSMGGKMSCYVFILITGYFMINSKFNIKKILLMIFEMYFYSIGILFIFKILKIIPISTMETIKEIFPIFWGNWFCVQYILLYFLIPIINPIIKTIDKKNYEKLLTFLIIVWSIIPTLTNKAWRLSEFDNFIIMYLIGSYFSLYSNKIFEYKKINRIILILSLFLMIISVPIIDYLGMILKSNVLINASTYFGNDFSILTCISAIYLFLVFKDIFFKSKFINWIASSTLGIYLIHDNNLVRKYLVWTVIFPNNNYFNSGYTLYIHAIIKILIIFLICLVLDKLRIILVEKNISKIIDRVLKQNEE